MENDTRTSNSIKNSITSILSNIMAILVGFVSQALFIRILNAEYLGLNGLFTNILTMLSFFELGIGNAIVYYMYKPLAENDKTKIKMLMNFYKKSYRVIALIVFVMGMLILPFIKLMVNEVNINVNIYLIYFLFLISTVVSYLMVYKRNIIYANQKNYYINIIHCIYLVVLNLLQIVFLALTQNYYLYLIIKIICQIIENFVITILANKLYPFIVENENIKMDKVTEKNIFKKVKALIFHKIGFIIINGTDNIIISKYFNLVTVGLYSNYNLIINSVYTIFNQALTSITSSVGNLLVKKDSEKNYLIFKRVRFINFIFSCFSSTSVLVIMQPFISVWVGEEYLLERIVLFVLVFNLFQKLQRCCYMTFKDSAGIWEEDKFIPIVESVLNIVFSILLLRIFGLAGVFLGTITSGLTLWCYSYPKFVYKRLFNRSYLDYIKETIGYVLLFIIVAIITYGVSALFAVNNVLLQIIINIIVCCIVPNLILYILFRKTDNFAYFKSLVFDIINKMGNVFNKNNSRCD